MIDASLLNNYYEFSFEFFLGIFCFEFFSKNNCCFENFLHNIFSKSIFISQVFSKTNFLKKIYLLKKLSN